MVCLSSCNVTRDAPPRVIAAMPVASYVELPCFSCSEENPTVGGQREDDRYLRSRLCRVKNHDKARSRRSVLSSLKGMAKLRPMWISMDVLLCSKGPFPRRLPD